MFPFSGISTPKMCSMSKSWLHRSCKSTQALLRLPRLCLSQMSNCERASVCDGSPGKTRFCDFTYVALGIFSRQSSFIYLSSLYKVAEL